jgi:hypothetical protein
MNVCCRQTTIWLSSTLWTHGNNIRHGRSLRRPRQSVSRPRILRSACQSSWIHLYVIIIFDPFLSGAFIADMVAAGKGLCHSEKTISDGRNAAMQTIVRIPQANMHLPPALVRVRADQIPTVDLPGKLSLSCDDFAIN